VAAEKCNELENAKTAIPESPAVMKETNTNLPNAISNLVNPVNGQLGQSVRHRVAKGSQNEHGVADLRIVPSESWQGPVLQPNHAQILLVDYP